MQMAQLEMERQRIMSQERQMEERQRIMSQEGQIEERQRIMSQGRQIEERQRIRSQERQMEERQRIMSQEGQIEERQRILSQERQMEERQRIMSQEKLREQETGIDLSLLAALSANSQAERRPMPDLRGAITAEDLEASFLTEPDPRPEVRPPRLPPGFGGPSGGPPHPALQQQLLQRHMMEQNSLRQRQLSGDILGIQALASLGLGDAPRGPGLGPGLGPGSGPGLGQGLGPGSGPGLGPGLGPSPGPAPFGPGSFGPMILPYRLPSPLHRTPGDVQGGPGWPSGFPNTVLFPGDLRHPLLQTGVWDHLREAGRVPPATSNPLPIPSGQPITPEPAVAEGSPMTPPNLHNFHFED